MAEFRDLEKIFQSGLVRDLALQSSYCRNMLEKLGIDTCCGGGKPLKEAAELAGVNWDTLRDAFAAGPGPGAGAAGIDWSKASNEELIDYILRVHHASLREELPRLELWFRRAAAAHRDHAAELEKLYTDFAALAAELPGHLEEEERWIFPAMRQNRHPDREAERIRALETQHTAAGDRLHRMSAASHRYRIPDYACPTVEMLFRDLAKLDAGLHEHIFLENNILFPRLGL